MYAADNSELSFKVFVRVIDDKIDCPGRLIRIRFCWNVTRTFGTKKKLQVSEYEIFFISQSLSYKPFESESLK